MALRFAFVLLFSVCAFGLGIAAPAFPPVGVCGPNSEYLECGSACAPDCARPVPPDYCTMQCVIGCFCKEGFLKNAKGECVRPNECEAPHHKIPMQKPTVPQCPDNEEFYACGTACPATCANPIPGPKCTKNCVIGCFCKEGHLRNSNGLCVPTRQCEAPQNTMLFAYPPELSQCNDNEVFLTCGSACAPTCAKPHPGPKCTKNCVIGCFCKPGFLKNEHGVCIKSENCGVPAEEAMPMPPQMCGDNAEFRQCKGCDRTCKNPNPICPMVCIEGCACKRGYVRENGKCIMISECSSNQQPESFMMLPPVPKCSDNEVFHSCGTACPATCANPQPSPVCTKNCVIGCFCKEGHLRNAQGVCVAAANCAAKPVPIVNFDAPITTEGKCASDREMFTPECGNQFDCMATCGTRLPFMIHGYPQLPQKCTEMKCAPSCVCMHPYVRNTKGQCVERKECDHVSPFTTTMTVPTTTH